MRTIATILAAMLAMALATSAFGQETGSGEQHAQPQDQLEVWGFCVTGRFGPNGYEPYRMSKIHRLYQYRDSTITVAVEESWASAEQCEDGCYCIFRDSEEAARRARAAATARTAPAINHSWQPPSELLASAESQSTAPTNAAEQPSRDAAANSLDRNREERRHGADDVIERLAGDTTPQWFGPKADLSTPTGATKALIEAAVGKGNVAALRRAIREGADIDAKRNDTEGATALMWAAYNGDQAKVWALLEAGANVNATDNFGDTAADEARAMGHDHIVAILQAHGGKVDDTAGLSANSDTDPAEQPSRDASLAGDATPQWYGDDLPANEALWLAASEGNVAALRRAIREGADVNAKDPVGGHPLLSHAACNGHQAAVLALLEAGADVNATGNRLTAADCARAMGHDHIVAILQAHGGKVDAQSALVTALHDGNVAALRRAIREGADVNAKDDLGDPPLAIAAMFGHQAAVLALWEAGADVNAKDDVGGDPLLSSAARSGHQGGVLGLLEAGANVNATDNFGNTPVDEARAIGHDHIVAILEAHGGICRRHCPVASDQMASGSGSGGMLATLGVLAGVAVLAESGDMDLGTAQQVIGAVAAGGDANDAVGTLNDSLAAGRTTAGANANADWDGIARGAFCWGVYYYRDSTTTGAANAGRHVVTNAFTPNPNQTCKEHETASHMMKSWDDYANRRFAGMMGASYEGFEGSCVEPIRTLEDAEGAKREYIRQRPTEAITTIAVPGELTSAWRPWRSGLYGGACPW